MQNTVLPALLLFAAILPSLGRAECREVKASAAEWRAVDRQYSLLERAILARDVKSLFALYAPDFEAHNINGSVWKLKESSAYTLAAFDQVKENIHLSNTIIGMVSCAPGQVKATVLQQWTRMQQTFGKLRRYETASVQDETWIQTAGGWKRLLVENIRPGAWYVDAKRVDPARPYDPDAAPFAPHAAASTGKPL